VVRVKTYIAANRGAFRRILDFLSFMVSAFVVGLFEKRPDVVVSTSPQFFAAVGGWALAAVRRVPFVFELGDLWPASIVAVGVMRPSLPIRLIEKLELFLYRRSASVVALTNAFKENLVLRKIPAGKIAVVINGVDLWRYGPCARDVEMANEWDLNGKFVIGYVGTHGMAHALMNVLNTAEILKDQSEIRFLLAGAGAERDLLIEDAKRRNLDNVVFMPAQPKECMPAVWSLCDVALVHLKDSDVFKDVIPSKIFEAMAMGLPLLLAAPDGEASDIITGENVGIHVKAETPSALADAAKTFYQDEAVRAGFAQQSRQAAPRHSREHQARHMIDVLEKVVSGKGNDVANLYPSVQEGA
jgi:colanic acid biosynthesis glycosyl transferase WcaI